MKFSPEQRNESAVHYSDESSYAVNEHIDDALLAQPVEGASNKADVVVDTLRRFLPGIKVIEEDGAIVLRECET